MTDLLVAPTAPSVATSDRVQQAPRAGRVKCEVVVIGTGAGGAMAGTELAKAGRDVLFLEAGGAYAQKDFQRGSIVWSTTHLFNGRGMQGAVTSSPAMIIPSGRVVGGSTVLNSGIAFRTPDARWNEWADNVQDERLRPASMSPFVDEVWRRIGVSTTHAGIGRRNNTLLQTGMARIGATNHAWMERNAPTCIGCGMCHMGCPSGGKASVDKSLLPEALNHGARIFTRARVEGIVIEAGRATGVEVVVVDEIDERPVGRLRVDADLVIVAGSAFGSPLILQASGLGGPQVGRHLAVHPALIVIAEFDEPVVMWDGVPQGYYAHDPVDDRALIEAANAGPAELFALFGRAGMDGAKQAKRFAHFAMSGTMIRDVGGGTVTTADGFRPWIEYHLQPRDLQALRAGNRTATRAYFAAGARRVCPGVLPMRFYDQEAEALAAIDGMTEPSQVGQPYASHPQGTCRMGPADGLHQGVVDGDGRVHGVDGVYVMDGSIFPTTLGVNPQVTIMSLALALSRRLAV